MFLIAFLRIDVVYNMIALKRLNSNGLLCASATPPAWCATPLGNSRMCACINRIFVAVVIVRAE